MNIGKSSHGGGINPDTCNAARKTQRLLVDSFKKPALVMSTDNKDVLEIDCWEYFINLWLGGMTKEI